MTLDRGILAKIDRRIYSELDHGGGVQLAKIPLSAAGWSTWKRYCEAIGFTIGDGIAGLINHELRTVVGETKREDSPFVGRAEERVSEREQQLVVRENTLGSREERLRTRERQLRVLEQRLRAPSSQPQRPSQPRVKVGRNERCPCGSGLKYKHCHGLAGR